jgi:hypothetical protein
VTRSLYPGDPRDNLQWNAYAPSISQGHHYGVAVIRPGRIASGETYIADMAFGFHQDSLADHLDQYPIMLAEVDQLRIHLRDMLDHCARVPYCTDPAACVWPGDFNADGAVDPLDLLHWGVMHGSTGPARNGRVNWAPQPAESWATFTGDGVPFEHGDATGDGRIDSLDILLHLEHYGHINLEKPVRPAYPPGEGLIVKSFRYNGDGIRNLLIETKSPINNILGLAFAFDFDRETFQASFPTYAYAPSNGPTLLWSGKTYAKEKNANDTSMLHYAFVYTDHQERQINARHDLIRIVSLSPKSGVQCPDSTFIDIRYLYAVDAAGNDLHLGCSRIWIYKETLTSITDPDSAMRSRLWPNPTADLLHVDTPRPGDATLHDTQGRLVRAWTASDLAGSLSLQDLPAGLYFLKLRGTGEVLKIVRQ